MKITPETPISSEPASEPAEDTSILRQIRKLVGHSAVYGLGLVGSSVAALILTPMFLHKLNKVEYGTMEVLNAFASMIETILMLGMASVLIKIYVNDCRNAQERKTLMSTVTAFTVIVAAALIVVSSFFSEQFSWWLLRDRQFGLLVWLAAAGSGLLLVQHVAMLCLRARQWPGKFVTVSLAKLALIIALNLVFVWRMGMGVLGVQLALISALAVALVISLYFIRVDLGFKFSPFMLKRVLLLSLPLIPLAMAPWVMNMSDKYFMSVFQGLAMTGIYAVGYKIGHMPVGLLINAFQLAWSPLFYQSSEKEDGKRLCANVFKYYLLGLFTVALGLSVYSLDVLKIISKPEYWEASWLVPFYAFSHILYAVQFFAVPIFIRFNKGKTLSFIMGAMIVTKLVLSITLIPRYGMTGAIISTTGTFLVQATLNMALAYRLYPVPYQVGNILKILGAAAAVYFVFGHIDTSSAPGIVLKLMALPAYFAALYLCRFFGTRELAVLRRVPADMLKALKDKRRKVA